MIEAGADDRYDPTIEHPIFCFVHMDPSSKANIAYQGNPPVEPGGKAHIVPSGGVLGGGSSINLTMYSRGQRSDYESWNTPGWTAEELVPYFKKLETYHGPDPTGRHGTNGPIHISGGTFRSSRSEDAFVTAAAQVGWPEIEDLQRLDDANNGIQRAMRFVSPDGKRQSTAAKYLHPLLQDNQHPNLHVVVETQVVRVLITGGKATGVEFNPNPSFHPETSHTTRTVTAKRQVILSCGALGTPLVLERSGVGSPDVLARASVPVTVPLPGVGAAYQDHNLLVYPYFSSLSESETLDALATNRPGHTPANLLTAQSPLLGWNGQDVTCKLRPSPADVPLLHPALRASWAADFAPYPDRPLMLMSLVSVFGGDPSTLLPTPSPEQHFSISTFTAYPYSRGHIHITTASPEGGAHSPTVDFDPGFFSDARDVAMRMLSPGCLPFTPSLPPPKDSPPELPPNTPPPIINKQSTNPPTPTDIWSYKSQRSIARRMPTYRGEHAPSHPPFPPTSAAACGRTDGPVAPDAPEIVYSDEDERILEAWLRANVGTTWHSLGTCAMRAREDGGVVDGRLRVYGVEGLRVADLSIVPGNVAANTGSTAMMIGEKAAGLVGEDLGVAVE